MASAVRVSDGIYWVGYVDWNVRDFHGYHTARGVTYNAYLVCDEKTALVDTIKDPSGEDLLRKIASVTDPSKIDYVVSNHAEPDHAGALGRVMELLPNATCVCNEKGVAGLARHFDTSRWKFHVVSTGDTLSLGRRTLEFIDTPMVHWPESMFTYVREEKLLFSMDAFGQHYATSQRFDDEVQLSAALDEAKAYYANIVMPFGKPVAAALAKAAKLDIHMIAPAHGVIWRSHVGKILQAYENWSVCRPKPKVLVIYDTMWDSTGRMARAIHEGASIEGVEAVLLHVRLSTLTRIAAEVLDAATVAFGSSTLNRGMLPMAGAVLMYWRGLRPTGKAGFAFGSYGWGKGGPEEVNGFLESMGWEIVRKPLLTQYRPTPEVLDECRQAGRVLAEKARQMAAGRTAGERVCVDP
jgi:flavorubredoxin